MHSHVYQNYLHKINIIRQPTIILSAGMPRSILLNAGEALKFEHQAINESVWQNAKINSAAVSQQPASPAASQHGSPTPATDTHIITNRSS